MDEPLINPSELSHNSHISDAFFDRESIDDENRDIDGQEDNFVGSSRSFSVSKILSAVIGKPLMFFNMRVIFYHACVILQQDKTQK